MFAVLRRVAILATATALAGALAGALPEAAQASYFDVVAVGSPASNVGALWIQMGASAPIVGSSITAELYAPGSTTPALTVTGFALTSGDNTGDSGTTWTVSTPISQASLPLGTYTVAVQARDSTGDTLDNPDAGSLGFLIEPSLTISASPATFSYGETVTFSGTDEGLYPDGHTEPVAGQPIALLAQPHANFSNPPPVQLATTTSAADGSFSFTLQAGTGNGADLFDGAFAGATATATVAGGSTSYSNTVGTGVQEPVKITASVSPSVTPVGGKATISGTVTVPNGSASLAVAGLDVNIGPCPVVSCGVPSGTVTTNASGQFSFTFTVSQPYEGPPWAQAYQATTAATNWLESGQAFVDVPASHLPVTISAMAQKTAHGRVFVIACPSVEVNDIPAAPFPKVTFEEAFAPSGPWHKLAGGGLPSFIPGTGGRFACFTGTVSASRPFVRAVSAGDEAYQAAASPAFQVMPVNKSSAEVVGIGPRHIARGGRVELFATFRHGSRLNPPWPGLYPPPARFAQVLFRAQGSRSWKVISTRRLVGDTLTAFVRLDRSGYLRVRYPGNLVTEPSESRSYYIRVTSTHR